MSIIRKEQLSNPLSASYALTASFAENANATINTSSLVTTSSFNAFTASINNFTSSYNTGSFSGSFIGNLNGTASWADRTITASYTPNALTTASVNLNTITFTKGDGATFPITVNTGSVGSTFPYTGSAIISGSLTVTGSVNISGSTTQVGNNNLLGNTTLSGSITISGSVNAQADINLGGVLRLDPAQDPGPSNLTASYLFTSASNTAQGYDLYYRQDGNIVKFKWIEGGISTGLLYGGLVSGSGQTIYVSSGSGIIMTSNAGYNQEINPIYTYVTWGNYSASAAYIASSQTTYIYVDNLGVIHQQPNYFTEQQYQEAICLGRLVHANYTNITGIGSNVQTTYDSDAQQSEFIRAFGPLKINGLTVTGQPGTLRINIGEGISYNLGGYYSSNAEHPSSYTSTSTVTGSMARAYRSGSAIRLDNNGGAFYTVIDPTRYDRDGDGTLATVGSGNWSIQRVFYNPESKRSTVYYGQERYTSLLNALQYLNTDPFLEGEFTAKSLVFVAYLVVKGNTSDLTDTDNSIVQAGLFRNTTGGSGAAGSVTISLENLSDVNITTPVNGEALIYSAGTWENGYPNSASFASTASYVNPLRQNVQITGSLFVSNSIDSQDRYLLSTNGGISVDWNNKVLRDGTPQTYPSVDWSSRQLKDSSNDLSIDWDSRALQSDNSKITWDNDALYPDVDDIVNLGLADTNRFKRGYFSGEVSANGFIGDLTGTATTASYTPNALVTASVTLNTITFTKGNGSTFPITVNTGSGGGGSGISIDSIFGGGEDGDLTTTSGTTTLTRDFFYNNITLGTSAIITGNWRLFCRTLTFSGSGAVIQCNGNAGGNGGASGGFNGSVVAGGGFLASAQAGSTGAGAGTAGPAVGVQATIPVVIGVAPHNNIPGNSGKGGNTAARNGGAAGTHNAVTNIKYTSTIPFVDTLFRITTQVGGNSGGRGGSSGASDVATPTRGGGGGGAGAGCVVVFAETIDVTNAIAPVFAAQGGNGGNGGSTSTADVAGGGGGAGGSGGYIIVVYKEVIGGPLTGALNASGGNGGNGGSGGVSGAAVTGGNGGGAGGGGRIVLINVSTGLVTHVVGTNGANGSAATGTAGAAGATSSVTIDL